MTTRQCRRCNEIRIAEHTARRRDESRANLAAACRSCKTYGRIAPACPVCLGRGYEAEREDLT